MFNIFVEQLMLLTIYLANPRDISFHRRIHCPELYLNAVLASDVLPFPAESATVNGGTVCCPLFVVVVWSGGSMISSADKYY